MQDKMNMHELEAGAKVMRALGHPVRLGVLQCLNNGEKSVNELAELMECSQSMMSQQLSILENQRVIGCRKDGTTKYCSLRNPAFMDMYRCLHQHLIKFLRVDEG